MNRVFKPAGWVARRSPIEAPPPPVNLITTGMSPLAPIPAIVMSGGPGGLVLLFQRKIVFNPAGTLGRNNPTVVVPLLSQSPTIGMSPVWPIEGTVMSPSPRLFVLRRKNV